MSYNSIDKLIGQVTASDVCRLSQIAVQECIQFDWQSLLACCNPTDPTGLESDLNIIKPNSTGFKYYQA